VLFHEVLILLHFEAYFGTLLTARTTLPQFVEQRVMGHRVFALNNNNIGTPTAFNSHPASNPIGGHFSLGRNLFPANILNESTNAFVGKRETFLYQTF
jgi:hypothetical protein